MPSFALRRALTSVLSLMLLGGMFSGCDCGDSKTMIRPCQQNDCCQTDKDCFDKKTAEGNEDPSNWACKVDEQRCYKVLQTCNPIANGDTECCPGQACNQIIEEDGICADKGTSCTLDDPSSCTVKGQYCSDAFGSPGNDQPTCTFRTCNTDSDCSDGLSCFNNYCVGEPPCRGGCQSGGVCTPVNNICYRVVDATGAPVTEFKQDGAMVSVDQSCHQTCDAGYMLVFEDGRNVFNTCDPKGKKCLCAALPPIRSNDTSRFADSVIAGNKVFVSAYDADHGDLVLHTYETGGARIKTEWVDGVPTSGALTGDPNGPRGGRAALGPDVGQYTSIAYDAARGATHIAYYAVRDGNKVLGDLRYARRVNDSAWTIFNVDGIDGAGLDTGDVGLYTSITIAPDGAPVIAYFQKGGVGATAFQTGVKVARAKSATPAGPADWTLSVVDSGTRAPPPCNAACKEDEVCADVSGAPNGQCIKQSAAAGDCKPSCKSDEFCGINNASQSVCFPSLRASMLAGLPEGNGLFPSITYLDSSPALVWYDRTNGQLKGVIATADSPAQGAAFRPQDITVLDNGNTNGSKRDVGQFTSLAVGPSGAPKRLAVSYMDATTRQLRLITAGPAWADLTPVDERIVDNGVGDPTGDALLFVGADSSVKFVGDKLSLVYQDSTGGDLRLAAQDTAGGPVTYKQTLVKDGAGGFYANLLVDGTSRYATHTVIKARQGNGAAAESANRIEVVRVP